MQLNLLVKHLLSMSLIVPCVLILKFYHHFSMLLVSLMVMLSLVSLCSLSQFSKHILLAQLLHWDLCGCAQLISGTQGGEEGYADRKSTRLNSSHTVISYAVFCLKKKKKK